MKCIHILLCLLLVPSLHAQSDTTKWLHRQSKPGYYPNRMKVMAGLGVASYAATTVGLSQIWYKDYPRQSFHIFNDNKGWLFMDKIGHATTTYYMGRLGIRAMRWTGANDKLNIWAGGLSGWGYMAIIEYLDGRSVGWGASPGDMMANTFGSAMAIGQELAWKEQRISLKWSYQHSIYAQYRPDLLGHGWKERWLKDYNGQTYWLSANISQFLKEESKFPKWLNIAVGYGADGMTNSVKNATRDLEGNPIPSFERYRQWYISPDIEWGNIQTRSKFLKTLFAGLSIIKIPAPSIEFNRIHKVRLHALRF